MTSYQALYDFCQAWLIATNPDVLTTNKVWLSTQVPTNPRPALPYATVLLTTLDTVFNEQDEVVSGLCDAVQVTGGTTSTTYTLVVQGVTVTCLRVAGDTNTTVAQALSAAISGSALWSSVTCSSTGAVLYVAARGGVTLAVTTSDPNLTLTTGNPYNLTRGMRKAKANIQVYGGYASEYLVNARAGLALPGIRTTLQPYLVWAAVQGDIQNLSAFMDTANEARALMTVNLRYLYESRIEAALPARTGVFHITATPSGTPDIDFTVGLT
jgi:hypothetical protein